MPLKHIILLILLVISSTVDAHKVLLMIEDNGDGTIYIEAEISTGGSIAGSTVILKDKSTGQPLSKEVLPESGEMTVKMPEVPYTVVLDLGKGHTVTKTGPFKNQNEINAAQADSQDNSTENNSAPGSNKIYDETTDGVESLKSKNKLTTAIIAGIIILLGLLITIVKSRKNKTD